AGRKALSSEFREFVKSRGLAGELKSLLRTRLVQEFRRRDGKTKENKAIDMSLRTKALISLIGDYLKRTSRGLSLSVLLPDYGLSTSDILSGDDISQALGLRDSYLPHNEGHPLLVNIVDALRSATEAPGTEGTCVSVQTDPPEAFLTLEEKLRALEDAAATPARNNDEDRHGRLEERMLR
ncbi:oxidative DNA demethylase, partial [Perkinsus olseni]